MTPEQLETAARRLCEIRGDDPDRPSGHSDDPATVPLWVLTTWEIEQHAQRQQAIDYALLEGQL